MNTSNMTYFTGLAIGIFALFSHLLGASDTQATYNLAIGIFLIAQGIYYKR